MFVVRVISPCRWRGETLASGRIVREGDWDGKMRREDLRDIVAAGRGKWVKAPDDEPTLKRPVVEVQDPEPVVESTAEPEPEADTEPEVKPKRRRGRPPKNRTEE